MSEWNKQRLDQMIADGVEESLSLDYKRADSLAKTDGKKTEVTKDVSAFANSTGGGSAEALRASPRNPAAARCQFERTQPAYINPSNSAN